ncbi:MULTISPECIES: sirohydrochlorin cobaltochelatase [Mediterraneibacter]|uniref:sirohydrochlorin cobaltochelatase n=1 Tax=Mediterraneibacter TaxID=2316020 RepID=UPI0022E5A98F|nr:sirohydrochlorin cobaltochelatase [Mediterraneibacter massiliensis]
MKEKKAILVVSFGTSYLDTLDKTIGAIERKIAAAYPDYRVYRAFTSRMIIKKLKRTRKIEVDTVKEALNRMIADGIGQVIVQPTHVINGIENDRMMDDLMEQMDAFQKIRVGKPLLNSVDDYKKAIHAVMSEVELQEEEMLVLMGHGTEHHANAAYPTLEYTFHALGYQQVLVGTVESFPELKNVLAKLQISGKKKVLLMPFMIVAGDHARNDMAGEEDSWMSELTEEGYEVRAQIRGLGEMEGIQNLFLEHIEEVM